MRLTICRKIIQAVQCIRNFLEILLEKTKSKYSFTNNHCRSMRPFIKSLEHCKKKAYSILVGDFHIRKWSFKICLSFFYTFSMYRWDSSATRRLRWPVIKQKDSRTKSLFCDFKDNSSTFNGNVIDIPKVGKIPVLMNPKTGSNRDAGIESSL